MPDAVAVSPDDTRAVHVHACPARRSWASNELSGCLHSAEWAACVSRGPHSPQNLAVGLDCAPQEPQNSPVAVSPPPPSPLGSTSESFHC
jgi:hypothetical protein